MRVAGRLVPLHETAVAGLGHYLTHRQETRRGGDHVFVSEEGQPLMYWKVHSVFRTLLKSAGLKPSRGRWPRIHELRHTFAVRALESSPTGRQRIGQHMLALATYWVMSTSTLPTGTWKPRPNFCATSPLVTESLLQGGRAMTSLAPHMEAFLREHLARHRGASQHTCDSYAYSFQSLFEFAAAETQSGSVGADAGAVGRNAGQRISWNIWKPHVATQRRRETSAWLPSARSSVFCSTVSQRASSRFAAFWRSHSRKPTLVWWRIWSRKKCRLCLTLPIHLRGREFGIEPCCILRCALDFESPN